MNCKKLRSVSLPLSIRSIPEDAFNGCISLTDFKIPSGVTEIGAKAFYNCNGFVNIELPYALKKIGDMAFAFCNNIMQITIPANVSEMGYGVFADCTSMIWFFVDENNAHFKVCGNCIIETSTGTLIQACTNSTLPDDGTVIIIGPYAFSSCDFVNITVPDGVKTISDHAFNNCKRLNKISIPDSVDHLDVHSLRKCTNLREIHFEGSSAKWEPIARSLIFDCFIMPAFYYFGT